MKRLIALTALVAAALLAGCDDAPRQTLLALLPQAAFARVSVPGGDIRWGKTLIEDECALADLVILNKSPNYPVGWAEFEVRVTDGETTVDSERIEWNGADVRDGGTYLDDVKIGLPRNLAEVSWAKARFVSTGHCLILESTDGALVATFTLLRAANRRPEPGEAPEAPATLASAAP